MIFKKILLVAVASIAISSNANSLRVLVTLPDFIQVAKEVGGDFVDADSFLDGSEDPHFVDAVPSFISKAAKADIVCAVGLELEIGWLPKVLSKSANAKVQSGGNGFCELGRSVRVVEKLSGNSDRSQGDVHAAGNPHFYLSPTHLVQASKEMLRVFKSLSPENAAIFESNQLLFEKKMTALKSDIEKKLSPLKAKPIKQYHKEFTYFFLEYGLSEAGALEEKPGVPPSAARIAAVAKEAKANGVILALGALHTPLKYLEKFSELSNIPHLKLPSGVQKQSVETNSIEKLQNFIADELLRVTSSSRGTK
jgi:zinc/manganese transport system substrate-binding protein